MTLSKMFRKGRSAFTLVEVVVSMVVFVLVAMASIQSVQIANILNRQAYENHIATAFLQDYMENLMAMRYIDLVLSTQRNIQLLDGRALPSAYSADTWISADNTADLNAFPELAALTKANVAPAYQVNIVSVDDPQDDATAGTGNDYKILTVRIRWAGARYMRDANARTTLELQARRYLPDSVDYVPRWLQ